MSLPKFTGDPTRWTTFWDSFSSAIHSNEELNDIDKFQYLRSLLEGTAAATIPGLQLTSHNYNHAVDLLTKRFGSKQVIISKHMERLMQLSSVEDGTNLKQLRHLLDKTEATMRSLQAIGISTETYGTFLTPVIMTKIPQELRLILSRGMSDEWDLDTLMKSFEEELQVRERCSLGTVDERSKGKEKREFGNGLFRRNQGKGPPTSSTLFSNSEKPPISKEMWCTFCNGPHPSVRCAVVTESAARKNILRQKGRCFGCLRSLSRDCHARCYRCGGKHHVSLCCVQDPPNQKNQAGNPAQEQTVSTNLYFTQDVKNNCVLLQTARARVANPNQENHSCNVRILLDSCSQKSYISTRLRYKLQLPSIGSETVLIKTFGKEEATLKKCNSVQFTLDCLDHLKVFISAYDVS